jgi:chorismate mutase/prephenate dehydratase
MSDLNQLRLEIDRLDDELLKLLNQRSEVSRKVGEAKRAEDPNPAIYRPEREAHILRRLRDSNPGPLPAEAVSRIYHEILSASSALQRPIRVAYLGPAGTFSESAVVKQFGRSCDAVACANFDEVFRRTETGDTDFSMVPVENSTEGMVPRALDLLLNSPLKACAEVVLRVHQNLMRKRPGTDGITKVYSHAQSLAQTQGWLARNLPGVDRVTVESNAEAARLASLDENTAAIAGENAAENYGLTILAPKIEDDATNRTRFIVAGNYDAMPSGKDRTWLVMSAPNKPGAVHALLTPFAKHGVSMTKLESRPSKIASMPGSWEYLFYVDIEGHQNDRVVASALAELKAIAPYLKIFGSYPVGDY